MVRPRGLREKWTASHHGHHAMCCAEEETSSSERALQFAGDRVIARPTDETGDEIGSAVRIVPDERVNIVIAACVTRCEGVIVALHIVFPFLVHFA